MGIISDGELEGTSDISLEIPGESHEVTFCGKDKMINHLVNKAKEEVIALEAVSRPKFSVGSLVGTVFDSEDVGKITNIKDDSYTLRFEDGFEMLGITADQLVELSS